MQAMEVSSENHDQVLMLYICDVCTYVLNMLSIYFKKWIPSGCQHLSRSHPGEQGYRCCSLIFHNTSCTLHQFSITTPEPLGARDDAVRGCRPTTRSLAVEFFNRNGSTTMVVIVLVVVHHFSPNVNNGTPCKQRCCAAH